MTRAQFRQAYLVAQLVLMLQFLIGMAANLFVFRRVDVGQLSIKRAAGSRPRP
jgi:hypothetical protein